jgi:hypothetical protein
METSAATASGLENLAAGASAAVGMILVAGKAATLAGRVDDTGANTSAAGADGAVGFLQGLAAAATAAALAALTAANVMEGMDGYIAAFPPCSSFLLGILRRNGKDDGAGAAWATFAVFLLLRWGRVLVDFMIQMNSMN